MSDAPTFLFFRRSPHDPPSGFDLGHVRVTLGEALATSEGRTPDQASMIYITATELADQARHLLVDRRKAAEVIGADSSFRLSFRRCTRDDVELEVGGQRLGVTSALALAHAIASATSALLDESPLDIADPVHHDVCSALEQLRAALASTPAEVAPQRRRRRAP